MAHRPYAKRENRKLVCAADQILILENSPLTSVASSGIKGLADVAASVAILQSD
jgi:hypothetical protein